MAVKIGDTVLVHDEYSDDYFDLPVIHVLDNGDVVVLDTDNFPYRVTKDDYEDFWNVLVYET